MDKFLAYCKDKDYWPAVAAGLLILIAFLVARPEEPAVPAAATDCSAQQELINSLRADLAATAKAYAKCKVSAGAPRPSSQPGCPDCPACPQLEAECSGSGGGNGSGDLESGTSQGISATAKADIKAAGSGLTLDIGSTVPIYQGGAFGPDFNKASIEAAVGLGKFSIEAEYQPSSGEVRVGPRLRLIGGK